MTVQEMLDTIGEHGFEDTSATEKLKAVQASIWRIERLKPWPWLETTVNLNFDGTNEYPSNFPTDFRAMLRVKDLTTGGRIMPLRLEEFEDMVGANYADIGDPLLYYFEGLTMKVWPIPPAATARLKVRYLKWSPTVDASTTESGILIPKYFHRVIVEDALESLYAMEDDTELATYFQGLRDRTLAEMIEAMWQRQYDRPDSVQIVDNDDWDYFDYLG